VRKHSTAGAEAVERARSCGGTGQQKRKRGVNQGDIQQQGRKQKITETNEKVDWAEKQILPLNGGREVMNVIIKKKRDLRFNTVNGKDSLLREQDARK